MWGSCHNSMPIIKLLYTSSTPNICQCIFSKYWCYIGWAMLLSWYVFPGAGKLVLVVQVGFPPLGGISGTPTQKCDPPRGKICSVPKSTSHRTLFHDRLLLGTLNLLLFLLWPHIPFLPGSSLLPCFALLSPNDYIPCRMVQAGRCWWCEMMRKLPHQVTFNTNNRTSVHGLKQEALPCGLRI